MTRKSGIIIDIENFLGSRFDISLEETDELIPDQLSCACCHLCGKLFHPVKHAKAKF